LAEQFYWAIRIVSKSRSPIRGGSSVGPLFLGISGISELLGLLGARDEEGGSTEWGVGALGDLVPAVVEMAVLLGDHSWSSGAEEVLVGVRCMVTLMGFPSSSI
jgi:hypothetical protein